MTMFSLTEAEAKALIDHATSRYDELSALIPHSTYALKESERFEEALGKQVAEGKMADSQVDEYLGIHNLYKMSPRSLMPFKKEKVKNQEYGYFIEHPSFCAMSHQSISSNYPAFVGTPSLDNKVVGLEFSHGRLSQSRHEDETYLSDAESLLHIGLSSEQFAMLIRDRKSSSPCAINRSEFSSVDTPPRLLASVSIAKEVKAKAMKIGKPLTDASLRLQAFMSSDKKISSKADYAEFEQHVQAIKDAMELIREPMNELLAETAGLMAHASSKQLLADIAEPLKALGMDESILKLISHNS